MIDIRWKAANVSSELPTTPEQNLLPFRHDRNSNSQMGNDSGQLIQIPVVDRGALRIPLSLTVDGLNPSLPEMRGERKRVSLDALVHLCTD